MTEQKSAFKGTIARGDGTLKTFANESIGGFRIPDELVAPLLSSQSHWFEMVAKREFVRQQEEIFIPVRRSPELQHWMNEHKWAWTAMSHGEISGDTAEVLMKYCAQQIDWQTQAERAKAKQRAAVKYFNDVAFIAPEDVDDSNRGVPDMLLGRPIVWNKGDE